MELNHELKQKNGLFAERYKVWDNLVEIQNEDFLTKIKKKISFWSTRSETLPFLLSLVFVLVVVNAILVLKILKCCEKSEKYSPVSSCDEEFVMTNKGNKT